MDNYQEDPYETLDLSRLLDEETKLVRLVDVATVKYEAALEDLAAVRPRLARVRRVMKKKLAEHTARIDEEARREQDGS